MSSMSLIDFVNTSFYHNAPIITTSIINQHDSGVMNNSFNTSNTTNGVNSSSTINGDDDYVTIVNLTSIFLSPSVNPFDGTGLAGGGELAKEFIFDRLDVRIIFITLYSLVFCCCFFGKFSFFHYLFVCFKTKSFKFTLKNFSYSKKLDTNTFSKSELVVLVFPNDD
jgi:hypothetical protein